LCYVNGAGFFSTRPRRGFCSKRLRRAAIDTQAWTAANIEHL
jgi:hypothetical protein